MSQFWPPLPDDSGWITPVLENGTNLSGNSFGYRRINGIVYLRGRVSGLADSDILVTLPTGYRIDAGTDNVFRLDTASTADGHGRINIKANGQIQMITRFSAGTVTFTGVSFPAV